LLDDGDGRVLAPEHRPSRPSRDDEGETMRTLRSTACVLLTLLALSWATSAVAALTGFTISNPYCYQPDPAVGDCMINFRFMQATDNQTSAPYMTWLRITIAGHARMQETAFFEGTITYSYDMAPGGFKVPCGAPNAGGAGNAIGNVYSVTVTPLDSSQNPMSTDIANVSCPAF
jgi:hypothetical protein